MAAVYKMLRGRAPETNSTHSENNMHERTHAPYYTLYTLLRLWTATCSPDNAKSLDFDLLTFEALGRPADLGIGL